MNKQRGDMVLYRLKLLFFKDFLVQTLVPNLNEYSPHGEIDKTMGDLFCVSEDKVIDFGFCNVNLRLRSLSNG